MCPVYFFADVLPCLIHLFEDLFRILREEKKKASDEEKTKAKVKAMLSKPNL